MAGSVELLHVGLAEGDVKLLRIGAKAQKVLPETSQTAGRLGLARRG